MKEMIAVSLSTLVFAFFCVAEAQQTPKVLPRIGFISSTGAPGSRAPLLDEFRLGLRDLGYIEGKNFLIELRYAEGRLDRMPALVNELADYLLFADEAPPLAPLTPPAAFAASLEARTPRDRRGRSFGQLDAVNRLLRYPCSYMVYSDAFNGLPKAVRGIRAVCRMGCPAVPNPITRLPTGPVSER